MKTNQMRSIVAAISGVLLLGAAPLALADSTDDIINALIGKGVLTKEEGALLQKGRTGEKETAEKKKAGEVKASFKDGLVFESDDKETSIKLIGCLVIAGAMPPTWAQPGVGKAATQFVRSLP